MNYLKEEGLICQGFIAMALQLVAVGIWREWEKGRAQRCGGAGLSPGALGAAGAAWHLLACPSPEGLPVWAAAWAGVCRCELYVEHFHPCQVLDRGSQGEEYGLLLPFSFALCVWRGDIIFVLLPVQRSRGSELPWLGVEVCRHWLEDICMCRPCVMVNVQRIWASASEKE